jgi:hypothetical protein
LLRCIYCDSALFVDRSGFVSHYRVPQLLDREQARSALQRWMAGNHTVKDLDKKAKIQEMVPLAFPLWFFRFREGRGASSRVEPAAPTPIPQLADLEVPAGKLEPFVAAKEDPAEIVPAQIPLSTARQWLDQRQQASGQEVPVEETALVHVPLWRCAYHFQGTTFTALVDASTGTVLASVFPTKSEGPYFLVAGLGLVLFGLEGLVLTNLLWKLLAFGFTAVPLVALAFWVARRV